MTTTYPFQSALEDDDDINAMELFRYAVEQKCSDIHLKPGSPPKLRIQGELVPIPDMEPLTAEQLDWIVQQTMSERVQALFAHNKFSSDYGYDLPNIGRFRINAYKTRGATAMVARHLIDEPPTFDDLRTNPVIADLMKFNSGLILVSGATGSGKTTLMAAMIQRINSTRTSNIISVEDPIEIVHRDISSSVSQREVGLDVESFAAALKDSLREDPDVILIGEIRDEATARAALKAAETGHLVISTIHATNTPGAITRFLEIFPHVERDGIASILSGALRGIIGQRLVANTEGKRTAVNEILLNSPALQHALEENNTKNSVLIKILEDGIVDGMQTFEFHLAKLFEDGEIVEHVARDNATDHAKIAILLDAAKQKRLDAIVMPKRPPEPGSFSERVDFAAEHMRRSSAATPFFREGELPAKPTLQRPRLPLPPRA